MIHALPYAVRSYAWPSQRGASQMLLDRILVAQRHDYQAAWSGRLAVTRANLHQPVRP